MEKDGVASAPPSMVEERGDRASAEAPQETAPPPQPISNSLESTPAELPANSAVEEGWNEQVGGTVQEVQNALPEAVSPEPVQLPTHHPKRNRMNAEQHNQGGGAANHADKVFVGGISWQAQESDLTNFFCKYGQVVDSKIIRDAVTGKSKGYGFVTFADEKVAASVKTIGFVDLLGRKCQVGDAVRGIGRTGSTSSSAPSSPVHPGFFRTHPASPVHSPSFTAASHGNSQLPPAAPAERRVFVGGLPRQADESALHYFFSQWGPVAEVKIIYDNKRVSKGYGFVTFHNLQTAALVKSCVKVEFMGRQMNVGDAVRGMAGQMRARSGSTSLATPGSPQHGYESMQYSPSPAAYGSPVAMQGFGVPYPGYPGYAPMDYTGIPGAQYPTVAGYGVPGYTGYSYPGGAGFPGMDYVAYSQDYPEGYPAAATSAGLAQPQAPPASSGAAAAGGGAPGAKAAAPVAVAVAPAAAAPPVTRTTVPIPAERVETFAQPDSPSLRAISGQSGAAVALLPAAEGIPDRHLEVTGAQHQVEAAQKLVKAFLSTAPTS
mmetsp:Transcript_13950/g.29805  ORF Transcript_13950/g.29805 Transcript_13950/m.29805 type:complete len:547 (-) Transcript_13950:1020-2660(-)